MKNETPDIFTGTASVYRMYFKENGYTVEAFIDDSSSLLVLVTDHGTVDYQWSRDPRSLGAPNLTEALANRWDVRYIADKLLGGHPTRGYEYDEAGTRTAIAREILSQRRAKEILKFQAREAWDELYRWWDLSHESAAYDAVPACIADVMESYDIGECVQQRPTFLSNVLYDLVIPALKAELQKALNAKAA